MSIPSTHVMSGAIITPPYEVDRMLAPREFYNTGASIPSLVISPLVCDRNYRLTATFEWTQPDEGVIFSMGDRFCGIVLYVQAGALHFVYQWWQRPIALAPIKLSEGQQRFELRYRAHAGRQGEADLILNDATVYATVDLSPTMLKIPNSGMSVGLSRRLSVSEQTAKQGSFAYSGSIDRIRVEPGKLAPGSMLEPDEAVAQALIRKTS